MKNKFLSYDEVKQVQICYWFNERLIPKRKKNSMSVAFIALKLAENNPELSWSKECIEFISIPEQMKFYSSLTSFLYQ